MEEIVLGNVMVDCDDEKKLRYYILLDELF